MTRRIRRNEANLIGARAAAFKLGKLLGHPHPRDVPLEDLAMSREVFVTDGSLNGAEGRLIRKKRSWNHSREGEWEISWEEKVHNRTRAWTLGNA